MSNATDLTPTTHALVVQAFSDEQSAADADGLKTAADQALTQAQASFDAATQAALSAHQKAAASAMTALQAVAAELGITLPVPPAPTPPPGP